MSLFPSLPESPSLDDVFRQWPEQVPPLIEYHDRLLRGDSPLSVADRAALFHFMNRIIEGTGVVHLWDGPPDDDELRRRRTSTYTDYMRSLGIPAD